MVTQKKELKVLGNMIDGINVFGFLYKVDEGENVLDSGKCEDCLQRS